MQVPVPRRLQVCSSLHSNFAIVCSTTSAPWQHVKTRVQLFVKAICSMQFARDFHFNHPSDMDAPQGHHPGKSNTSTLDWENQLQSSSGEQDDLVPMIANTLLSRFPALTRLQVDVCFKAANAAVRYTD